MKNLTAFLHELYDYGIGALIGDSMLGKTADQFWYIDGNNGNDNRDGRSPETAFASFAPFDAANLLGNGDVIVIQGVVRDQWTAPIDVFDVTIIGNANSPRQATDGGVATGGGATWLAPTSPTAATPLLTLREQGWTVINVFFGAETDAACVKLNRQEISAAMDASHATFINCRFGSGAIGIEDYGGHRNIQIFGCIFRNLTTAIDSTNVSIATPAEWQIIDCKLLEANTNGIVIPLNASVIKGCSINKATTTTIDISGGGNNHVQMNSFNIAAADFDPAGGITGNSTDAWSNYLTATIETGVPAN
jgi:hypothetical protein